MSAGCWFGYVLVGSMFFVAMGFAILLMWALYKAIKED